jgi:hypothetical protein
VATGGRPVRGFRAVGGHFQWNIVVAFWKIEGLIGKQAGSHYFAGHRGQFARFVRTRFAFSMSLQEAVGLHGLLYAILGLSLFSPLAAFLVRKQGRATLFFGNLATALLWLMVPKAVL